MPSLVFVCPSNSGSGTFTFTTAVRPVRKGGRERGEGIEREGGREGREGIEREGKGVGRGREIEGKKKGKNRKKR